MSNLAKLILVGTCVFLIGGVSYLIRNAVQHTHEIDQHQREIDQRRLDSIHEVREKIEAHIALADSLLREKDYDSVLAESDQILQIDSMTAEAHRLRGDVWRSKKKYATAIEHYTKAIALDPKSGRCRFDRAVCYTKQKKTKEAVADVKCAMTLHYPGADSLHEKINPLKKRVVGTHTVCCDGSTSYSTGRGTCSHHGGVCGTGYDYETYREF